MKLALAVLLAVFAAAAAAQGGVSRPKPPTKAEQKKMAERVKRLDFATLCTEAGRALRQPRTTPVGKHWDGLVMARANIPSADVASIKEGRLSLGMDECSAIAILGKPDSVVRTDDGGQLVYREKKVYVHTANGVVRAWQDDSAKF